MADEEKKKSEEGKPPWARKEEDAQGEAAKEAGTADAKTSTPPAKPSEKPAKPSSAKAPPPKDEDDDEEEDDEDDDEEEDDEDTEDDDEDDDEEEDDEDDDEEEDDEDDDEEVERPRSRQKAPTSASGADDWLPDWAPWAVLIGLIVLGLAGALGLFSSKSSGGSESSTPTDQK
jgi:hypothetical protein